MKKNWKKPVAVRKTKTMTCNRQGTSMLRKGGASHNEEELEKACRCA